MNFIFSVIITGILFVSGFSQSAHAQFQTGVAVGTTKNAVKTNHDGLNNTRNAPLIGISGKIQSSYSFNSWFGLQTDIEYLQKNFRSKRYGFYEGIYTDRTSHYLQIPITTRIMFGGRHLKGFVNIGAYGGLWLAARSKGVNANILSPLEITAVNANPTLLNTVSSSAFNEKYRFDNNKDNRLEFGYVLGSGIQYKLTQTTNCFIQLRYYYAATNQQKEAAFFPVHLYNETFDLSAGITFNLTNRK